VTASEVIARIHAHFASKAFKDRDGEVLSGEMYAVVLWKHSPSNFEKALGAYSSGVLSPELFADEVCRLIDVAAGTKFRGKLFGKFESLRLDQQELDIVRGA
jgi:hypothetical protein